MGEINDSESRFGKSRHQLVVDANGLRVEQRAKIRTAVPWRDIDAVSVLGPTPVCRLRRTRGVLVIRLRPNAVAPVQNRLTSPDFRAAYVALTILSLVSADAVLLHETVERFGGPVFRTEREMLDLDYRLIPKQASSVVRWWS